MKNLKKLYPMLILLFAVLMLGSGCSNKGGWQTSDAGMKVAGTTLKCPDGVVEGDRCVAVAKTPFDWSGSEKISVVYTAVQGDGNCTYTNKKTGETKIAKCGTDIVAVKSEKDRLATVSGHLIGAASNIGGKFVDGHYRVKAAEEAEGDTWIIAPSASAGSSSYSNGGSSLVLNDNKSSSGAVAQQGVEVGVGVSNESGGSCTTGNCQ